MGKFLPCLLQLLVFMTIFLLEIMVLRYGSSEKQKNVERFNSIQNIVL